jgi:ATP-dependent protease Clp ATPase subunit
MLSSEGSILKQYTRDMQGYDIDINISSDAITEIADKASKEKTGARGLATVLEKVFREFKFELPSLGIKTLAISKDKINDPLKAIDDFIENSQEDIMIQQKKELDVFAKSFQTTHNIKLVFSKTALDEIFNRCIASRQSAKSHIKNNFKNIEYGIKLICEKTDKKSFTITGKFVKNPEKEISGKLSK